MPFAENLAVFFSATEFASVAVWSGHTANVIMDAPTQDILGGKAQSNEYAMLLPTADLPGINRGASVVVDGVTYTVRESPDLRDDGKLKHVKLTKA